MDTAVSWRSRQTLAGVPHNHREAIVAFDFFTLPTRTFQFLYRFFVIEHSRRKILYFNVTRHPTSDWVIQELREVFPEAAPYRYVIFDHDCKFDADISTFLQATGFQTKRTNVQAWQNGIAERWVGSCRRDILDHVIALNETHLRRLIRDYVTYYHDDRMLWIRTHPIDGPSNVCLLRLKVTSGPRLGGLHHRYGWSEAA
jgi:putative transposase